MFSQNNEEQYILQYFQGTKGRFLDIGAYDGMTFSNTHALALAGWSGVCIEPSAGPFHALTQLYRDNDKIELVNAAVIDDYSDPRFPIAFNDAGGDAISTSDEAHMEKWKSKCNFRKIHVMPIQIQQIYRLFGNDFDFVNIDVEGKNIELAQGMNFDDPKMICIEHDSDFPRIEQLMEVYGFKELHRNGENIILVKGKAELTD